MDAELRELAAQSLKDTPDLSIIALGGYGRAELCPYSDIDLMFFKSGKTTSAEDSAIEKFLYALWDRGLKVGHSTRTLEDCITLAKKDSKVLTSLLDARLVHGNNSDIAKLKNEIAIALTPEGKRAFIDAKLAERDERHGRYGDTRYVLEPNIKEGKGGLRDFQTLLWITDVLYGAKKLDDLVGLGILTKSEAYKFSRAHDFLLTVRCHLHEIAGRAEERLHFDIQPDLAERFGYKNRRTGKSVERFMKHYFLVTRDVGDLTRILLAVIQHDENQDNKTHEKFEEFEIIDGRLLFTREHKLQKTPIDMLRIFRAAQKSGHDVHPLALKEIHRHLPYIDESLRHDETANAIFLDMITDETGAALALKRMNEAGVLGKFVPDFGKIIALMQFDRYHYFTVDEHIIRCIDLLHALDRGELVEDAPVSSTIVKNIDNKRALYVALFLHDICKGRGGRHADLGGELALMLCPRFGLSGEETDLVSWLVHEHLLMSDTAFRRNLNDPKTIADFSARMMRIPSRLDMLFVLTTVDIMGVGPGRWTAWKARLLEELYLKTRSLMSGEEPGMVAEIPVPHDYKKGETRVDISIDESQSATVIIVYTPDKSGLFATLCGALSAEGANIMRAYINTVVDEKDGTRLAVDRFIIQNPTGLPFRQESRQDDLRQSILSAINDTLDIESKIAGYRQPLSKKDLVFNITPNIRLNNEASGTDTVVEIDARDRHGLLYDITTVLRDQGLDIRAAKINTQGLRAIDAFYIQSAKRKKVTDATAQERLVEALFAKIANH